MNDADRIAQLGQVFPDLELHNLERICQRYNREQVLDLIARLSVRTAHALWAITDALHEERNTYEADMADDVVRAHVTRLVNHARLLLPVAPQELDYCPNCGSDAYCRTGCPDCGHIGWGRIND